MRTTQLIVTRAASLLLILSLFTSFTTAYSKVGCYSELPESYSDSSTYLYQTSSYCSALCSGYSYFALTQGNTCICGNEAPDSDESTSSSSCSTSCFGYGSETCGGDSSYDVYSNGDVSASSGSTSSSKTATTTIGSSSSGGGAATTTKSSTSSTTATTSTNTDTSQTTTSDSTTSAVSTQEVSGSTIVIYSTVAIQATATTSETSTTSSSTSAESSSSSSSSSSSGGSKSIVGPAVGGAVGGVVAIALILFLVVFFRRRQNKSQRDAELADSAYFSALKRDGSIITSNGVTGGGHNRQLSNPFISKEDDSMVDQRLNPVMLGRRRISEGSLADEADYSRKILRVANPDDGT